MIRMLGTPAFFVSLSAAETAWPALLQSLKQSVDKESVTIDAASSLEWMDKCRLIKVREFEKF